MPTFHAVQAMMTWSASHASRSSHSSCRLARAMPGIAALRRARRGNLLERGNGALHLGHQHAILSARLAVLPVHIVQEVAQLADAVAAVDAEGTALVIVEVLGASTRESAPLDALLFLPATHLWRIATHLLQLGPSEGRNARQAEMRELEQTLQQPKDGRHADILAVAEMHALETRVAVDETVDGLVGDVRDLLRYGPVFSRRRRERERERLQKMCEKPVHQDSLARGQCAAALADSPPAQTH